jgi:hypothetical protein
MKRLFLVLIIILLASVLLADGVLPIGDGTQSNPYQIASLDNLLYLSTNDTLWLSDAYFIQTTNIDASDTQNWNNGEGFSPIGITSIRFVGTYNGDCHIISNLYINRPLINYAGLFGATENTVIVDLGLEDVNFLCDDILGGFIGTSENSSIINCYCTGSLVSESYVGGIVGMNSSNSIISNSFSSGNFTSSELVVGGLVGYNDNSSITNCYSTANVNSIDWVGGLVGWNDHYSTVTNCYSTGSVSGTMINVGGLIGRNDGQSWMISNSFWDIQTSGWSTSAGGTGKTTTEMQDVATYTSLATVGLDFPWDFVDNPFDDTANEDYWCIDSGINNSYPYLANPYVNNDDNEIPEILLKLSNFPNPFNPSTKIEFSIQNDSAINLTIFNIKGQKINTLANNEFTTGIHSITWDGDDETGKSVSSGVYYYQLNVNGKSEAVKKCLLLK